MNGIVFEAGGQSFRAELPGTDISIPLQFNGPQPSTYGVEAAVSRAWESERFIGDTRRGGSCNFEKYQLVPHCNGTHTECVGHITFDRLSVRSLLQDALVPATLVTVDPVRGESCRESYDPGLGADDLVITAEVLRKGMDRIPGFTDALVVRTLPNSLTKCARNYMQDPPPFFSHEAMRWIRGIGVRHLLVDIPSLDRLFDEGKLSNHHLFWQMPPGSRITPQGDARHWSVTEFVYVPDACRDGQYLLNLQIAPFDSDAAPSRPVLMRIFPA